jgi:hypothetical protein
MLVVSKYTEEEDAEAEEASTLVTRRKRIKQAEFAQKNLKMSSDPQTDIPSVAAECTGSGHS